MGGGCSPSMGLWVNYEIIRNINRVKKMKNKIDNSKRKFVKMTEKLS